MSSTPFRPNTNVWRDNAKEVRRLLMWRQVRQLQKSNGSSVKGLSRGEPSAVVREHGRCSSIKVLLVDPPEGGLLFKWDLFGPRMSSRVIP